MLDVLSSSNKQRREQARLLMSMSPEIFARSAGRLARKQEAIRHKDAAALRAILEEERAELNILLSSV